MQKITGNRAIDCGWEFDSVEDFLQNISNALPLERGNDAAMSLKNRIEKMEPTAKGKTKVTIRQRQKEGRKIEIGDGYIRVIIATPPQTTSDDFAILFGVIFQPPRPVTGWRGLITKASPTWTRTGYELVMGS